LTNLRQPKPIVSLLSTLVDRQVRRLLKAGPVARTIAGQNLPTTNPELVEPYTASSGNGR